MKRIAKPYIMKVKPYQPGRPIDDVKRELGITEVIKLASNESPYGPSPKVLAAILSEAGNVNRYPDGGCFYLRGALSKKLGVAPKQLIFGNGSDEIIFLALRAFVGEGDEVILADPSFLMYGIASNLQGAEIKSVPLKDFRYDLDAMSKEITDKTKIIFLGNPDNPAGTYIPEAAMKSFIEQVPNDVLIFIVEAYYAFVAEEDYPDSLSFLKESDNVIVTRTFSKMYGLAGLRVGYGVATEETVGILERLREPFNINSLAQVAALACLDDEAYYKKIAQQIEEQRQVLYQAFEEMGLSYRKTWTNFILIDVGKPSKEIVQGLLEKGVIVRNMAHWGLDSFIRVTIGTSEENQKLISALKAVV